MIIIDDIEQGTPEWDSLRIANPGASSAHRIITTKGKPSASAEKYLLELFDEAILNRKTPTYSSYRMKEGILYEASSFNHENMLLAASHGVKMTKVGLCYKDEQKLFHVSPDGIQPDFKWTLETKDGLPHIQRERLNNPKSLYMQHFQQAQMALYVTGYEMCILKSYCENMPVVRLEIEPDLEFHKNLECELYKFVGKLQNMIKEYKGG